jgi:hypothetical protein
MSLIRPPFNNSNIQNVSEVAVTSHPNIEYLLNQVKNLDCESKSILLEGILNDIGIRTRAPISVVSQITSMEKDSIASILETFANMLGQ